VKIFAFSYRDVRRWHYRGERGLSVGSQYIYIGLFCRHIELFEIYMYVDTYVRKALLQTSRALLNTLLHK